MVTIEPRFIRVLRTSAALMDIACARSPTVTVSGTLTSRITGPVGRSKICWVWVVTALRSWRRGRDRRRPLRSERTCSSPRSLRPLRSLFRESLRPGSRPGARGVSLRPISAPLRWRTGPVRGRRSRGRRRLGLRGRFAGLFGSGGPSRPGGFASARAASSCALASASSRSRCRRTSSSARASLSVRSRSSSVRRWARASSTRWLLAASCSRSASPVGPADSSAGRA